MTIELIKQICSLGYDVCYLNNSTLLKKCDQIDDFFYFEVEIYEKSAGEIYRQKLPLYSLTYTERQKIYVHDFFIEDAVSAIKKQNENKNY